MRGCPMTEAARRRPRGRLLLATGLLMLATMLLVTIFGPLIAPYGAATTSPVCDSWPGVGLISMFRWKPLRCT